MGNAGLALALALSTAAGIAVLFPLWLGITAGRWQTIVGYGFACGQVLTTLLMRACFTAKLGLSFGTTATALIVVAIGGAAVTLWLPKHWAAISRPTETKALALEHGWRRLAWHFFMALIAIRLIGLILETWWRPLFPWDAWDIWAPKTKIWFESRDLNNFYGHFDNGYPPTINLIQVWANLGLAAWDDAKMNIAWPLLLAALALGAYGQAIRIGASPLSAAVVSYLLVSVPILDAHAALAGYADLPLAVVFGLAAIAFFVWIITNDTRQLLLALLFAAMAPLFKIPGVIWSLTLVPALLLALFQRSSGFKALRWTAVAVVTALVAAAYLYAKQRNFALTLYQAHAEANPASGFVFDNYFLLDNYHLLWYFFIAGSLVWWRKAIAGTLQPATILIAACVGFLVVSFFFTNSAEWWGDYGSINRATIHLVPALVFYLFLISRDSASFNKATLRS